MHWWIYLKDIEGEHRLIFFSLTRITQLLFIHENLNFSKTRSTGFTQCAPAIYVNSGGPRGIPGTPLLTYQ